MSESKFFAVISRMKYINRWALMRNTINENISEHSLEVAFRRHTVPNYAFASHCSSFANRCYALASLCFSMPLLINAISLHGTANLHPAMPLPLVACQNFASPLLVGT